MKLEFSRQIFEKYSNTKFQVGAKLSHADGRTDRQIDTHTHTQTHTKLIVAFRNFASGPKSVTAVSSSTLQSVLFNDSDNCYGYVASVGDRVISMEHWWNDTEKGKPKDKEKQWTVLRKDFFANSHRGVKMITQCI